MDEKEESLAIEVVTIAYDDLVRSGNGGDESKAEALLESIGQAFGNSDNCLGIICVSGIPSFKETRIKALRLTHKLATDAPKEVLQGEFGRVELG